MVGGERADLHRRRRGGGEVHHVQLQLLVGGLAFAGVGYDKYLRFVWPLIAVHFILVSVILFAAAAID